MIRRIRGLGLLLLFVAAGAAAAEWRMDPDASRLRFQASYQGEAAPGAFRRFDTRLTFDPDRPAEGRLQVRVALASFDMGSREIHEAVREPEWLDLGRFEAAEFVSTDIRRDGGDGFVAHGTLRVKGIERRVAVPFRWHAADGSARMTGAVTLDRGAFGIGTGEWAASDTIGLEVKVTFDVRLVSAG